MEQRIEQPLERVCQRGCRYVLEAIERLEQGDAVVEARGLDDEGCEHLLRELRAIMAVYDFRSCGLN